MSVPGSALARLERDLRWGLDPAAWATEALGWTPDPWQKRVLGWDGKRLILLCCRQSGKSTTTAALAGWNAIYQPGSLTILISPSQRQSGELFRKVQAHLDCLEIPPRKREDNRLSLTLESGSRIVSLPGSEQTVRGFSAASLIIEDEASWVSDALNRTIRPMMAVSGGRLILMSTPFGQRGHFWETWSQGGPEWERIKVTAYECPRITREFLAGERAAMGDLWFRSEYLCDFVANVDSAFSYAAVEATVSDDVEPLFALGREREDVDAPLAPGASDIAPLFDTSHDAGHGTAEDAEWRMQP